MKLPADCSGGIAEEPLLLCDARAVAMNSPMLAYHFDLKRPMWKRVYMDAMVDRLKGWGFNTLLYEIEDKLRFRSHPDLAAADAFSPEQTSDFVKCCRAKGVDVIPFMQSLGHAECVVGKPAYAHLRETPEMANQYDPLSEEARRLILELFDEIIDIFQPRQFFHMGGDETWSLGQGPQCAELMRRGGVSAVYMHHMRPIVEHLRKRGLRPMLWADMVLTHVDMIPEFPRDVVWADWDYFTGEPRPSRIRFWGRRQGGGALNPVISWADYDTTVNPEFRQILEPYAVDEQTRRDGTFRPFYTTDALRACGFDVVLAAADRCWGDMMGVPAFSTHLPNCFHAARHGQRYGSGALVTSWAVRHAHPELTSFGPFAAAYGLRTEEPFDIDALGFAFTADVYGAGTPGFGRAALQAAQGFGLAAEYGIQPARARLDKGEDPLPSLIEAHDQHFGGRGKSEKHLRDVLAGYAQARAVFAAVQDRAIRNARQLDFWIEGVDLQSFYVEFMLAAMDGTFASRADPFLDRLDALRARTRQLFSETYSPEGVEAELDARFGFHEACLRRR